MKKILHISCFLALLLPLQAQVNLNGTIDALEEFSKMETVPIVMPDGTKLMTDIYTQETQDSLVTDIDLGSVEVPIIGSVNLGTQRLELIPRGIQLFIYDTLDGGVNPNPYQMPMLFTRTPYSKNGDVVGRIVTLLGYNYALQDMRGRYTSEGVYFPMFSDSWNKNPYHKYTHVLDTTKWADARNGNRHEDGYNSVQYLANGLKRWYDLDGDGVKETEDFYNNGSIGMFGASALANTQLQAAAAHKIDPLDRGLKCLFPIVGTNEHYRYTGFQNGVFRDRIVTGWLRGQIADTDDNANYMDNSINNTVHSSSDYAAPDKFVASNRAIDHFVTVRYDLNLNGNLEGSEVCGYYPNSVGRADMDASHAPVNADGEAFNPTTQAALPNLTSSRYDNMDVPIYHLTGWWDIFIDGQLETWRSTRKLLTSDVNNQTKQKIVVGPWAHQTIGGRETGDRTYPANVGDIIGIAIDDIDINSLDINKVIQSEIISWFRLTLNNNENYKKIGEPKVRIPETQRWQPLTLLGLGGTGEVRVPAKDFIFPFPDLLNFMTGNAGLKNLTVEIKLTLPLIGEVKQEITIDVPATGSPLIPEIGGVGTTTGLKPLNYNNFPNIRFFVPGPVDDGVAENAHVGNYWFANDTFPLQHQIAWQNFYLHKNGTVNMTAPTSDEGNAMYLDDPDNPVMTVGGANMIVPTPSGDRVSQGQMQMNSAENNNVCLNRPGVLKFETAAVQDSICVIGYPKVTLYARSNPAGLTSGVTDSDFFVRIADEYPDGRIFFVFEGCVNGRARKYAKHIHDTGLENQNEPFSNINIGEIYEYEFEMMPIAYTWGKGHKMKVFIQGSNYPRYQANSHLPLNEGEFFRRKPLDGRGYSFAGQFMMPRSSVERIYFAPDKATRLELPIFKGYNVAIDEGKGNTDLLQFVAFPNPADKDISVSVSYTGLCHLRLSNSVGQVISQTTFREDTKIDVSALPSGVYFIQVSDETGALSSTEKVTVK